MSTTEPAAAVWPWPRFFRYVYAAKFLCGELKRTAAAQEGPVEPGSYATAINVHNPHGYPVGMRKKAILLTTARTPRRPSSGRAAVHPPVPGDGRSSVPTTGWRSTAVTSAKFCWPQPRGGRPHGSDLHQGLGRGRDARRRPARRRRRLRPHNWGPKSEPQPVSIDTGAGPGQPRPSPGLLGRPAARAVRRSRAPRAS